MQKVFIILVVLLINETINRRLKKKNNRSLKNIVNKFDKSDFVITDDQLGRRCHLKMSLKSYLMEHKMGNLEQEQQFVQVKGEQCFCKFEEIGKENECDLVIRNSQVQYNFLVVSEEESGNKKMKKKTQNGKKRLRRREESSQGWWISPLRYMIEPCESEEEYTMACVNFCQKMPKQQMDLENAIHANKGPITMADLLVQK